MYCIFSPQLHHTHVTASAMYAMFGPLWKAANIIGLEYSKFSLHEQWHNCAHPNLTVSAVRIKREWTADNTLLGLTFGLYGRDINYVIHSININYSFPHTHTHTHTYAHTYTYTHIYTHTQTHPHTSTHTHMHTHTHTNTQTHTHSNHATIINLLDH